MASAAALAAALAIGALTLVPHPEQADLAALTPWTCLACGELGGVDVILNILLFLPLGAALHRSGLHIRHTVAVGAIASGAVELLQATVIAGRDASLSDLLTNTAGAAAGAWLSLAWPVLAHPSPRVASRLAAGALLSWAGLMAFGAWAYRPAPLAGPLVTAWAPSRPGLARFGGRVLDGPAPGEPIADSVVTALAARRLTLTAVIVPGPATERHAPILDVTDPTGRPLLGLGRDGDDLVFTVWTRASAFRLRGARVRLAGAFARHGHAGDGAAEEAVTITAGLQGSTIWVERGGRVVRRAERRLGADQGWRLIAPFDGPIGPRLAALVTVIWVGAPLTLAGYWLMRRRR